MTAQGNHKLNLFFFFIAKLATFLPRELVTVGNLQDAFWPCFLWLGVFQIFSRNCLMVSSMCWYGRAFSNFSVQLKFDGK